MFEAGETVTYPRCCDQPTAKRYMGAGAWIMVLGPRLESVFGLDKRLGDISPVVWFGGCCCLSLLVAATLRLGISTGQQKMSPSQPLLACSKLTLA